jgi:hypothetical protein
MKIGIIIDIVFALFFGGLIASITYRHFYDNLNIKSNSTRKVVFIICGIINNYPIDGWGVFGNKA